MVPTKIVATVGPASRSAEVLRRFVEEGVDVIRLNMSHGTHEDHQQALEATRVVEAERGLHLAIMADLCGPKVRTGPIDPNRAAIDVGGQCEIVRGPIEGNASRFSTSYADFVDHVAQGHRVLIDDGQIRLRVTRRSAASLTCICEAGGSIGTRKGINVPDSDLPLPALTEKDHADLTWAVRNGVDFVALSFVRRADDIAVLREALQQIGGDVPILAKIETPQAIRALDQIIEACDGILVARGDLGVEVELTKVPMLQKEMVRKCRRAGKPVIIATQMLHSMVGQPSPTRAEVSDVANAVLDGADAVMLSAESAAGQYPVQAVAMMNRICSESYAFESAESGGRWSDALAEHLRVGQEIDRTTSAVARSAAMVAHDLGAKLIAVWCRTGRTARWISKYRVRQPLVGLSASEAVCRQLALCYDIEPYRVSDELADGRVPWADLEKRLVAKYGLKPGDVVVLVGDPTASERAGTISVRVISR